MNKLPTLVELYLQMEAGTLSLDCDEVVTFGPRSTIMNIGEFLTNYKEWLKQKEDSPNDLIFWQ